MKLIEHRAMQGISQTELAEKAKIGQAVISRIEKGVIEGYSVKTMKRIADALGTTVLEIDEFSSKLRGDSPKLAAVA